MVTRRKRERDGQYRGKEKKGILWDYMKSYVQGWMEEVCGEGDWVKGGI